MKTTVRLAAVVAMAATLLSSSAFADSRHRRETDRYHDRDRTVTVEGRIRDIDRERNGFVIRLDRGGYLLFAPVQTNVHAGNRRHRRVRDLERGDRIRATGSIGNRRIVHVEDIRILRDEDDRWDRDDRTLRGVVQSVDHSRRLIWIREDRSGRVIAVDVRHAGDNDRWDDIDDVRRGDRVVVSGDWRRNGRFEAERIDVDRGGRW